ncbi:MAG TPA: diphosphomevalonate decarboxylase [Polyangiaceae bacterium]|nr:diphosphomevalonate decarboxylase [Polyangiaceae bacterium]
MTPPANDLPRHCRAVAHSNIALAKYWGKRDVDRNLPDVPSLSMTLAALSTVTRVTFDAGLTSDEFVLNGKPQSPAAAAKVCALLDRVRGAAGLTCRARVDSENDFPTASGLASSASGFAALALASSRAAGLGWSAGALSDLARASSASAARSIFGGFVALEAGASEASTLTASEAAQQLMMIVAVTDPGPKAIGSSVAMQLTQASSPYYASFRSSAPGVYAEVRAALEGGDLERLGAAMEHSTLLMHACMLVARPALWYWNAGTLAALDQVRELRRGGTFAYFTIDAGPHVKVLTTVEHGARVSAALSAVPGVLRVIVSGIGDGARVLEEA